MNTSLSPVNDNIITHWLYDGKDDHVPHVAATSYLIEKYVSAYWKHDRNDMEYISMEIDLCGYLDMPVENDRWRELKIKWIARVLNVSPMLLHNDPSLPF